MLNIRTETSKFTMYKDVAAVVCIYGFGNKISIFAARGLQPGLFCLLFTQCEMFSLVSIIEWYNRIFPKQKRQYQIDVNNIHSDVCIICKFCVSNWYTATVVNHRPISSKLNICLYQLIYSTFYFRSRRTVFELNFIKLDRFTRRFPHTKA